MYRVAVLFIGFTWLFSLSCKKEEIQPQEEQFKHMIIPTGFDWGSTRDVDLIIRVSSSGNGSYHRIIIYDGNPTKGGIVLSTGAVSPTLPFHVKIHVPQTLNEVYVEKIGPATPRSLKKVILRQSLLEVDFDNLSTEVRQGSMPVAHISNRLDPTPILSMDPTYRQKFSAGVANNLAGWPPEFLDSDQDQVPDLIDDFPADHTKAFQVPAGGGTLLFEDQWPRLGDYDMNDVVISYQYQVITNSQNRVVAIEGKYRLKATGGTNPNGFAVEFPFLHSQVAEVDGGRLEPGQENAVVILFQNMRSEMQHWNVFPGQAWSKPKDYRFTITLKPEFTLDCFCKSRLNPFIWTTQRDIEVHLPGKKPTQLANPSLFGTSDDGSYSQGLYYVSGANLPWAMDIPLPDFQYPVEKGDISLAYPFLRKWAESGGALFKDWYSNPHASYRNAGLIYSNSLD